MEEIDKKKIRRLVLDALREMGISPMGRSPSSGQQKKAALEGPRALIVFNSGLRRVDNALDQVRLIERYCGKSAFFTAQSARSTLCQEDIKEKAGGRCFLDTVSEEGLEKVLSVSDILILPTFCFRVASKVSSLVIDDFESALVFSALIQGKKVLATKDSFTFLDLLNNEALSKEIEGVVARLKSYGVTFCDTPNLLSAFLELKDGNNNNLSPNGGHGSLKLITGKIVTDAFEKGLQSIKLAKGGKITPLASDLAKEYSIRITKEL